MPHPVCSAACSCICSLIGPIRLPPRSARTGHSDTFRCACPGGSHSLVASSEGAVYSFGLNARGQLGLGAGEQLIVEVLSKVRGLSVSLGASAEPPREWGGGGFGAVRKHSVPSTPPALCR